MDQDLLVRGCYDHRAVGLVVEVRVEGVCYFVGFEFVLVVWC